jgi:CheY-like chemotaxis protein
LNWLIAEDEADIRNLVSMMAQVWGHNPIIFDNGDKLWEWLDSVEAGSYKGDLPDFALMDIRMPGKRGNEIAKRIRETEGIRNIPIVLMTAFVLGDQEIEKMRNEFGIDAVINKPLPDFDQLKSTLDGIITKKQAG